MTPPAVAPKTQAFYFGNPELGDRVTETQMLGCALDNAFGTSPDGLARACEAAIFSEPTRARLRIKHLPALRAHAQCRASGRRICSTCRALGVESSVVRTREAATLMTTGPTCSGTR
jgi:hypothetical protein